MALKDHRMLSVRMLIATLLAVTFSLFGSGAFAASITIANDDFSMGSDFFDNDVPSTGNPMYPSWESYRPNGTEGSGQFYSRLSTTGTWLPVQDKVAFIDLKSGGSESPDCHPNCNDGEYPVGIQQFLDPLLDEKNKLQANSIYTLSVLVGNPKSGDGLDYSNFGGYRVELLAGGEVVAEDQR